LILKKHGRVARNKEIKNIKFLFTIKQKKFYFN